MSQSIWFSVGVVGMAFGCVSFLAKSRTAPVDSRHHYLTSFFITLWAAAMYLLMAQGYSYISVGTAGVDGSVGSQHGFWLARYVDWAVTTPLLLLGTASALIPKRRLSGTLLAGLIGSDIFMILTGVIASWIADNEAARYTWFAMSCGGFLAVLALLYGAVRSEAHAAHRGGAFNRLAGFLTTAWCIYPIVWILGSEGVHLLSDSSETAIFTIVDLAAKVVFGFMTLSAVESLSAREATDISQGTGRQSSVIAGETSTGASGRERSGRL